MFRWKFGQMAFNAEGAGGGTGAEQPAGGAAPPAGTTTEHPVSAPWGNEGVWTIGEGDQAKPWWHLLPDEAARNHLEAKKYSNPAELALANYNLTRLQTGDPQVISLPGDNATPEQQRAFYEKLGAPKDKAGYELKFGEGVQVDQTMLDFGRDAFFEAGLTPKQAQIVGDKWNAFVATQNAATLEADTNANNAALAALTSSWGAELEANKADGRRAIEALGVSPELINKIDANIGAAPIVELLATIGKKTREGGFITNTQVDPNNPLTMNKEQATARIAQLNGDPTFQAKYTDAKHPEHANAVKEMEQLFARV